MGEVGEGKERRVERFLSKENGVGSGGIRRGEEGGKVGGGE